MRIPSSNRKRALFTCAPLPMIALAACAGGEPLRKAPAAPPSTAASSTSAAASAPAARLFPYPATRTVDASDTYFGVTYKDPLRWLEDLKSSDTAAWFKAQSTLTDGILDAIPGRDALVAEWQKLDALRPASYSELAFEGGRMFYRKRLGGENIAKIFYREGWTGPEHLLFDPATYIPKFATARAVATVTSYSPSWNGKHVLLAISSGGAEFSELRVIDVRSGALLPEVIYPSYGGTGWSPDHKGFFYDAGTTTDIKSLDIELHRKAKFHELGTDLSKDREILSDAAQSALGITPKEIPSVWVNESAPGYMLGSLGTVQNEMRLYVAPAGDRGAPNVHWQSLAQHSDNLVRGFAMHGEFVYAATHAGAAHYRLVRTKLAHPDWVHAETVIAEAAESIDHIAQSKEFLFVAYTNGVTGHIAKLDLRSGKVSDVHLPDAGNVWVTCPDARGNRCVVGVDTWTNPSRKYDYDAETDTLAKSVFDSDVTYPGFVRLVSEEIEVPGHDGTMIPLSIVHEKGMALDGSHSCILEGYGAYGISMTPYFSVMSSLALYDVVLAFAHVRGGGEKGESWYKAGYKATKPNTWKDFISSAEYLVKTGYTSAAKLAGAGTSAGGILISRAVTERPDLFGAAVCNVGVANAMRAEFSANGPVNTPEFGSVKDPAGAAALSEMDGVMHVKQGERYPAILGVAGWNDPRGAPWQPGKLVAALQAASASQKPVLLKVNYDDGHFTEERSVTFRNFAAQSAFMLWQTGHRDFQPAH